MKNKRKDFEQWKISIVYNACEGLCFKCGKPLSKKFHRHHIDGDHSNNSIENLKLYCAVCHGGEAYTTYIKQKKEVIGEVGALVQALVKKEISGSGGQVAYEALKLKLSLIEQCYPTELEGVPVDIRVRNYLVGSGILLKEYEKGVREGMNKGIGVNIEALLPIILKNIQLETKTKQLEAILKKLMPISKRIAKKVDENK